MSTAIESAVRLLREGNSDEAERAFTAVLAKDAGNADALHGLSVIAFQRGNKVTAEKTLRELLALAPDRASAHYDLACMLIEQGRDGEALPLLERVTALEPRHVSAWYQLGFARKMQGLSREAEAAFHRCLAIEPSHPEATHDLARLYREQGDYPSALAAFERAAQTGAASPSLYHAWGQFASLSALPEQGLKAHQLGVARFPVDTELRIALAQSLENAGTRQHADLQYRIALGLDGGRGFAIGSLLALLGDTADPQWIETGRKILRDPAARIQAKAVIGYGLGKVYQARGDYAAAFDAWHRANEARRAEVGALDRAALLAHIEQACDAFDADALRSLAPFGSDDERMVFVVGMPRSGTTLVEQIIASHPRAEGLGELPDLPIVAENFCGAYGVKGSWPACSMVLASDKRSMDDAARHYLRVIDYRLSHPVARVVDKAPLNFFNLGLISILFPKARIIWCRRDPRDVCLSIFSENFAQNQRYATDLADLGFYYRQHERLMAHWRSVIVNPFLEVTYEELTAEQAQKTRELIDFIGVPWDAACLQFHQTERAVQTPSRWQVRKPMYRTSVDRWRRYEPWLQPLIEALAQS